MPNLPGYFVHGDHVRYASKRRAPVGAAVVTAGAKWVQIELDSRGHRHLAVDPSRLVIDRPAG